VEKNIVRVPGLETLDAHLGVSDVLAAHRTRMASERTLLSWIRTAISMITFGFSIAKLAQYAQAGVLKGTRINADAPVRLGITLVIVATVALTAALIQHELFARGLPKRGVGKGPWDLAATTAAFIVLLGVMVLAGFFFQVGPF
jgi:putative membrane protein